MSEKPDKGDFSDEQLPNKLPGAFACMESRPFDLVIVLKTTEGDARLLRVLQIYYAELGRLSSFQFAQSDPKYMGIREKFQQAALRALIKEVSSRHLAHDDFTVWYYNEADRRLIEDLALELTRQDSQLTRGVDLLVGKSKLMGENP